MVDPLIDFSKYDNWRYDSDYTHVNEPDGVVDMIVMVYRGRPVGWYLGEASLGSGGSYSVDDETITIETGYRGYFFPTPGSGVTCTSPFTYSKQQAHHIMVHEVGHWLLGAGHPYGGSGVRGYAFWAMMGGTYPHGTCANSFERERLAWIDVDSISGTFTANLSDFITIGDAYKYHPPNGDTYEFYYFENHQKLSIYDDATTNGNDKGVWVLHHRIPYDDSHSLRIKPSIGYWNWGTPNYNTTCFPGFTIGVFQTMSVNRTNGNSIREELVNSVGGREWPLGYRDKQNVEWCGGFFRGDAPFLGTYNEVQEKVFSPWSNPTTHTWGGSQTTFAMEVLNQSGSVVNVKFHTASPESAPPSKPQDHRVTVYNTGENTHPRLTWAPNSEPDLSGYEIWRRTGIQFSMGPWNYIQQ